MVCGKKKSLIRLRSHSRSLIQAIAFRTKSPFSYDGHLLATWEFCIQEYNTYVMESVKVVIITNLGQRQKSA